MNDKAIYIVVRWYGHGLNETVVASETKEAADTYINSQPHELIGGEPVVYAVEVVPLLKAATTAP